jgi:peptide-methionine (S)-S-oxide reductase
VTHCPFRQSQQLQPTAASALSENLFYGPASSRKQQQLISEQQHKAITIFLAVHSSIMRARVGSVGLLALAQHAHSFIAAPVAARRASLHSTCVRMVAKGDVATVQLDVKADGKPFDSVFDQGKVRFVVGAGGYLPAIHQAVEMMDVGSKRTLELKGVDAYGDFNDELVSKLPLAQAPEGIAVGQSLKTWTGQKLRVTDITGDSFTVDMNPPNAGKVLTVDLEVLASAPASSLQTAEFAAGCFWGLELAFQRAPGVVATKVGYTHGQKDNPTYSEVCSGTTGHAEAVQVLYDPSETTYEGLLDVFWGRHDPTQKDGQGNDRGTQYR